MQFKIKEWKKHFCFIPVKIDNKLVWLELVEKRSVFVGYSPDDCGGFETEYRFRKR